VSVDVRHPLGAEHPVAVASPGDRAAYGPTLVLTVTLAVASFLVLMSVVLLLFPQHGSGVVVAVIGQRQNAKTALYVVTFAIILPVTLIAVPPMADRIARGPNGRALPFLVGALAATLAATLIVVRLSARLPWGDGLGVLLACVGGWCALTAALLTRATRQGPWPGLLGVSGSAVPAAAIAGALLFGLVLAVTGLRSVSPVPLVLGAVAVVTVLALRHRLRMPLPGRRLGTGIDVAVLVLLLLAIPDTIIFRTSSAIPNPFFEPGIIQFQHDWILGPANQLLGGGGLMVNSPVSQYGAGMLYFLDGWFHLAPIGYGTFGLLDAILTALFYIAGYGVLRLARTPRVLAAPALAVGVVALIYNLHYPVGALPEQGPLRFGLPMAIILAAVAGARWPRRARLARASALLVLGVASIWALEGFAYTVITYAAMIALEAWLAPIGTRIRWLTRQVVLAVAVCLCAHAIFAGAILLGTGQLPDWGQYLAYLHALLLGGKEGSITYGFEHWSPGLAVGAGCLASAIAIVLLARRATEVARRERVALLALAGTTAYAIAVFSYTDNRSSTYLLCYTALPLLLAGMLWLSLVLRARREVSRGARLGFVVFSASVGLVMLAAAWPAAGARFSRSALAHAYPGGGLNSALQRLWHPPPIDPRAPEGARLVARYLPGRRALVLLPAAQDLQIEVLVRSGAANRFFIGFGNMDSFVPSAWMPKLSEEITQLRAGDRLLIDRAAQAIVAALRAHPSIDPLTHPIGTGTSQSEWILRRIDKRFRLRPIYGDQQGFVVAELVPR
jgi:hypothetical protein